MFKKILIATLIFLLAQTIHGQKFLTLQDTIAAWFAETKVATEKAKELWDKDIYGPLLFVNILTRQAYANYPDTGGILKKDGKIYTGILPPKVLLANASIPWGGVTWAMILIFPPQILYPDKYDRINLLSHELFHVAQPSLNFPRQNEYSNNHLDQKNGRVYLRLELEALKKAVQTADKNEMNMHIKNALIFRKYRHFLYPGADTTENVLDLNEGITEYTGAIVAGRNKTGAIAHFIDKIDTFLVNPTYVRTFPYYNIPVYGWLLRDSDKYWNKELTIKTNLTSNFIKKFKVKMPADLEKAVGSISINYGAPAIIAQEESREENRKKLVNEYKRLFIEQPVFVIPFYKKSVSFDSRHLMPLEDYGTVYPTMTAIDNWGILKVESGGGLMSPDRDKLTITVPLEINGNEIRGEGWTIKLNEGFIVVKDEKSGNYKMMKK